MEGTNFGGVGADRILLKWILS